MSTRTVTLRLDAEAAERLDRAARATRRPRARILREALERHLDVIAQAGEGGEAPDANLRGIPWLLSFEGAGRGAGAGQSAEDVRATTDWIRGDGPAP
jgi:hypothetical protein